MPLSEGSSLTRAEHCFGTDYTVRTWQSTTATTLSLLPFTVSFEVGPQAGPPPGMQMSAPVPGPSAAGWEKMQQMQQMQMQKGMGQQGPYGNVKGAQSRPAGRTARRTASGKLLGLYTGLCVTVRSRAFPFATIRFQQPRSAGKGQSGKVNPATDGVRLAGIRWQFLLHHLRVSKSAFNAPCVQRRGVDNFGPRAARSTASRCRRTRRGASSARLALFFSFKKKSARRADEAPRRMHAAASPFPFPFLFLSFKKSRKIL